MNFIVLALLACAPAFAQPPRAFDVVSVKATGPIPEIRVRAGDPPRILEFGKPFQYSPGRVSCELPLRRRQQGPGAPDDSNHAAGKAESSTPCRNSAYVRKSA